MDHDTISLVLVAAAALLAAAFTVVPVLPGTLFVPAGAVAIGFVVGWDPFEPWFWIVQAVLVALYLLVDNLAQLLGVKRVGGSRQAMVGGAIGVFVGPFALALVMGPLALLVGPPVGAVVGTIIGERRARRSLPPEVEGPGYRSLGMGALVAFVVGTTVKLAIVAIQVGLLLAAVR